ncbi:FAD-binding oxidoreductase [Phycicoccus sp. CSK15P-2]|uniref:FAD-binding oxidoreductase n=1 Tax=Phycicoccus sp. CSK15P-2 TaxID=2807627 RepID=UPI0019524CF4|nr:FAD-binding oxidoreductase [Phycicoccus sp. CSK15P-2]MBM6402693.1 FAD-binding oxidoreductase [Phycicoccus sp. CSK15P-2]
MVATALGEAARAAVGSACEVREATGDDAVDGTPAGLVARPADTSEVAEVMRASAAHGLSVVSRGAGTKLAWCPPPESADLVLDLTAMDRVLDHQAGDLIVEAEAGTPLAAVRSVVGEQGQRLVVDETTPGATVGGSLAAHASGPERMLAGTARDLLIGMTVVRADGVVARSGGRVVKNVAGYDLGKLLVGSFGTLGVITRATFRLHPAAETERWVSVPVADADAVHRLTHAVVHAQVVPAAVEVDLGGPARDAASGSFTVQLGGRATGVTRRADAVAHLLGGGAEVAQNAPDGWGRYPWAPDEVGLKLTCVLSGLRDVVAAAAGAGARVRGSAGSGVLYAALPVTAAGGVVAAVDRLRATCVARGGSAVVLQAPPDVERSCDPWGPVPALDLMRRVKERFDPDRRMAPGRFVGGI